MGTVPLFNPNNGLTGRDGGPYLDETELVDAERRRAVVEDREPDLDNPPAIAGVPLVTAGQLMTTANSSHLPSQSGNNFLQQAVNNVAEEKMGPMAVGKQPDASTLADAQNKAVESHNKEASKDEPKSLADPFSEAVAPKPGKLKTEVENTFPVAAVSGSVETKN